MDKNRSKCIETWIKLYIRLSKVNFKQNPGSVRTLHYVRFDGRYYANFRVIFRSGQQPGVDDNLHNENVYISKSRIMFCCLALSLLTLLLTIILVYLIEVSLTYLLDSEQVSYAVNR